LNAASGFRAASGTLYRPAIEFVRKAGVYAYRDRRQRKRHFRTLWITRLGAALRARGIHYNRFIPALDRRWNRIEPQDAQRAGDQRSGRVRCDRRESAAAYRAAKVKASAKAKVTA
jgi:hypothetical protein